MNPKDNLNLMHALTWKEPFASLMLHGKIETRCWNTNYRGSVLICSAKVPYDSFDVERISNVNFLRQINRLLSWDEMRLTLGCAIAVGKLVDSRLMTIHDEEKCFVTFRPELYCHVYEDVRAIVPMPWKGSRGWSLVDPDFEKKIIYK